MGRAEQLATVEGLVHQFYTSDETGVLLDRLVESHHVYELDVWKQAIVREFERERTQAIKLPEEFVKDVSRVTSMANGTWRRARAAADFSLFRDDLERIVDLNRRRADYLGYVENPYDALIDLYEPEMTAARLRIVFDRLKQGTGEILDRIKSEGRPIDDALLFSGFDPDKQLEFSRSTIKQLGFDFNTGRVDISAHPFCTSFGVDDVRLTTRIYEEDLRSCLFGLIHEAGHGMYEQGVSMDYARTPIAGGTSMGIHESQSLFWENVIGRSREFWTWAFPRLQKTFPDKLSGTTADEFYRMINVMSPSMIRVEADELTYNLHIILRFEIEDDTINGRLAVKDIPDAWNAKMEEYLGITPANDAEGCLQDVHWSFGGHGYFPSYSLGKLYAAMFREVMERDLPDLNAQIAEGDFRPCLDWLRENIHRWGRSKRPSELVRDICGTELSAEPFLHYMAEKSADVYGLE